MKLPCPVVRDLLPLYAEKMTAPETQALVSEHLTDCAECRMKLSDIAAGTTASVDTIETLHALKKQIRRRRWYAALVAGLIVFVAVFAYFYRTDSLKPLSWQDGLVEVTGLETVPPGDQDGPSSAAAEQSGLAKSGTEALVLKMDSRISGIKTESFEESDGTTTVILQAFARNPFSLQNARPDFGEIKISPVPDRLIYGYESPQSVLWGEPLDGGVLVLRRLVLSYYLLIAVALTALTGLFWGLCRKKKWSRVIRQVFFAPASYAVAHCLLLGTRTTGFQTSFDLCSIVLVTIALYALLSLLWQSWIRRRKEA